MHRLTTMKDEKPDLNVYGHNQPEEIVVAHQGIRDQSAPSKAPPPTPKAQSLKPVKTSAIFGEEHPEIDESPRPPRHAPLSDDVPS